MPAKKMCIECYAHLRKWKKWAQVAVVIAAISPLIPRKITPIIMTSVLDIEREPLSLIPSMVSYFLNNSQELILTIFEKVSMTAEVWTSSYFDLQIWYGVLIANVHAHHIRVSNVEFFQVFFN